MKLTAYKIWRRYLSFTLFKYFKRMRNMNMKCKSGLFLAAILASTFIADVARAAKEFDSNLIYKVYIYDNDSFSVDRLVRNEAGIKVWSNTSSAFGDAFDSGKSGDSWASEDFRSLGNSSSPGYFIGSCNITNVVAVPEPETYVMLLAGLGMLGFTARRRKNSSK